MFVLAPKFRCYFVCHGIVRCCYCNASLPICSGGYSGLLRAIVFPISCFDDSGQLNGRGGRLVFAFHILVATSAAMILLVAFVLWWLNLWRWQFRCSTDHHPTRLHIFSSKRIPYRWRKVVKSSNACDVRAALGISWHWACWIWRMCINKAHFLSRLGQSMTLGHTCYRFAARIAIESFAMRPPLKRRAFVYC